LADPVGLSVAATAETAAFTLRHTTPDTELFAVLQGVLKAVLADHTSPAHLFGLSGRTASLREEEVRVDPQAVG
jgi:hypothetical protein